ncbi:hypothetical protein LCGC14_2679720 [marine sediment metagenome]|uniref:Uncharacterized protein n=1 Tax=marine sediment metagenome TaxID=412755 RepID=A0A0F9CDF1_9ZZZZ
MNLYSNEKGRKRGATHLQRNLIGNEPLLRFELKWDELISNGEIVPFIPDERLKPEPINKLRKLI